MSRSERLALWAALCLASAALVLSAWAVRLAREHRADLERLSRALSVPLEQGGGVRGPAPPPLPKLDPDVR